MSADAHFIGIDVGTGSARACIVNSAGDIVGLAAEEIGLWQPQQSYYVRLLLPSPLLSRTHTHAMLGTINPQHLAVHMLNC